MFDNIDAIIYNWDEKQKAGWWEYNIIKEDWIRHVPRYYEYYVGVVEWIQNSIEMPYRHCRWRENYGQITVRFRYERDYIRFILRWS